MTDWTFDPDFVAPFYLHFMNGNLAFEPADVQIKVLAEFRLRAAQLNEDKISDMLEGAWRSAKVAAWYIAFGRREKFIPRIQAILLERPMHIEHLCIALAWLPHPATQTALLSYLEGCATGFLQSGWQDESIAPDWALNVIKYFGDAQAITLAEQYWEQFIARLARDMRSNNIGLSFADSMVASWKQGLIRSNTALVATLKLFELHLNAS